MAGAKAVLFVVSFLSLISAIIMICVGAVLHDAETENAKLVGVSYLSAFALLIAAGAVGFIAFILGLIGAIKEAGGLIKVFLGFMVLVFILALVAGIIGFVYYGEVDSNIYGNMNSAIDKYGTTGESEMTNTWNVVQKKEECCGVHYFTDWRKTQYAHNRYDKVPGSCCKPGSSGCDGYVFKIGQLAEQGCYKPVRKTVLNSLQGAGITGIIFAVIELILIILGATYSKKLGKDETEGSLRRHEMKAVPTSDPYHSNESKPTEFL